MKSFNFNYKLAFWALVLTLVSGATGYWTRGVEYQALNKYAFELFQAACLKDGKEYPAAKNLKETCSNLYKSTRNAGIPNPFQLISRIKKESSFCTQPIGPTKDVGCMMVHIPTWGTKPFGCDVIMSDRCNIDAGVRIYAQYLKQFNGNDRFAHLAYVNGPDYVYRNHIDRSHT